MVLESKQERIRKQQLIRKYSRLLLGIPFLFLIAFLLALYVGEFRPSLIRKCDSLVCVISRYNKAAKEWSENGIAAFANQHFYAKSSSGTLPMIETTRIDGECYPVRDTCNRYEDPPEGCNLTKALYYASTSLVLNHQGVVYIQRQDYSQIAKIAFKSNITYVLNRSDLNCGLHPWPFASLVMRSERCSTFCNQLHGIWNTTRGLCHIELFIQSICIRVKSVDGTWVLDTDNERRLPANRAFELYDSDGVGCSYSNNWHSVMYDYRKTSAIPVFVRSTSDSYLFASAYTRGCSSETRAESSCFGETRLVKRHVYCVLFVFTLAVCIIETCLVLFFLLKEKKRSPKSSKGV